MEVTSKLLFRLSVKTSLFSEPGSATVRVSSIVLTKLDILESFDTVKICTGYKCSGRTYDYLPASRSIQGEIEPIYEEFPGWEEDSQGKRLVEEMPANLMKYVRKVEELIGVPVYLVSTNPKREDIIELKDFKSSESILGSY